jgi:signal transduction histidine kinase/CheY-like chemotaxis protein
VRIRTQLVALVAGVALPLFLLAGFVTWQLWQQQRHGYQQQFLERASAVRLALDTGFGATVRTLRTIGDATDVPAAELEVVLRRRFQRFLENNPDWDSVVLTDPQGTVVITDTRPGAPPPPVLDAQGVRAALASDAGFISNLIPSAGGRHVVVVAAATTREDGTPAVVYAAIRHTQWLSLLRSYPVSARGTLTLLDRESIAVARTLDDSVWVGKKAPAAFSARVSAQESGFFKTEGMDGASYYVAFSASPLTGWVVATGVPEAEVDDALYWQSLVLLLVGAVAMLGTLVAAWRLGKAINVSMRGLLDAAHALHRQVLAPAVVLPTREAREVRQVLAEAHAQLLAREASLSASLEREAAARLQAESGNRAKDQFLAMMGHELRNPLSTITAAVAPLPNEALPPDVVRHNLDIVKRQAGHLATMINDLMDLAQLESGEIVLHKAPLDLAQVATKVLRRFEESGRCAHLQMRTVHGPAWVDADEARIALVLSCLLDNACKHTPRGGTVTIEVLAEADASVLRVRDTGVGIAAPLIERVFDAFSQGERGIERAEGGLGVGLALARKLVQLHGGSIAAASEGPGYGAVLTVRLPRAEAPPPAPPPTLPAAPPGLRFSVVEDIPETRELMVMLLEADGHRVNAAADGPTGVQAILEGPSDVALVDIGLPGFDGLEVARRVRQAPGGERVLLMAMTGYGTDADRARAMDAGFDAFLVKPFEHEAFEAALAKGLAERGARSGNAGVA